MIQIGRKHILFYSQRTHSGFLGVHALHFVDALRSHRELFRRFFASRALRHSFLLFLSSLQIIYCSFPLYLSVFGFSFRFNAKCVSETNEAAVCKSAFPLCSFHQNPSHLPFEVRTSSTRWCARSTDTPKWVLAISLCLLFCVRLALAFYFLFTRRRRITTLWPKQKPKCCCRNSYTKYVSNNNKTISRSRSVSLLFAHFNGACACECGAVRGAQAKATQMKLVACEMWIEFDTRNVWRRDDIADRGRY